MTLRRLSEPALYAGLGFLCDLASTGFTRAVASGQTWLAICCNVALMVLTVTLLQRITVRRIVVAWIVGQSAGIYLAMQL